MWAAIRSSIRSRSASEGRNPSGKLEVVVEAVLDRGADRDLGAGPEVEHRGRQHVGGVVAEQPRAPRVATRGEDLDALAISERRREVADLAVHPDGERILGEPRPDRRGRVGAGCALLQLERRSRRAA